MTITDALRESVAPSSPHPALPSLGSADDHDSVLAAVAKLLLIATYLRIMTLLGFRLHRRRAQRPAQQPARTRPALRCQRAPARRRRHRYINPDFCLALLAQANQDVHGTAAPSTSSLTPSPTPPLATQPGPPLAPPPLPAAVACPGAARRKHPWPVSRRQDPAVPPVRCLAGHLDHDDTFPKKSTSRERHFGVPYSLRSRNETGRFSLRPIGGNLCIACPHAIAALCGHGDDTHGSQMIPDPVRRVVTGHDALGRAVIQQDGPPERVQRIGGAIGPLFYEIWNTRAAPAPIDAASGEPAESGIILAPPSCGTRIRVLDIPPDGDKLQELSEQAARDHFAEIGAAGAVAAAGATRRHAFMHRTETIDYGIVLEGEIVLIMDEGETTIRAGDIVVQRGTNHGWSNRSDRVCRIAFILIDGQYRHELAAPLAAPLSDKLAASGAQGGGE